MSPSPHRNKIDPFEPLPAVGEPPDSRWAVPYLAQKSGLWTVHVRRPLTRRQLDAGLVDTLSASTLDALRTATTRQDDIAERLATRPYAAPTWAREK
ncbi:hypothetical protein ACFOY4_23230 [Actinomadura syzygii]|uniref:Uncharacterized protein n=1 Tax=Actinomadura syzygii TaxID=1427538 RepID=A0A5D0UJT9_9ACTN|nr:hypothetical protein [Actinomadura syzygii]TYC18638.1 hypothetical protein FXF65_02475 [Actinomadura syzygii]